MLASNIKGAALAAGFELARAYPGRNYLQENDEDRLLLLENIITMDGAYLALCGYAPDDDPDGPILEVYRVAEPAPPDLADHRWVFPGLNQRVTEWLASSRTRQADVSRSVLENFLGWFEASILENEFLKEYVAELEVEIDRLRADGALATAELRDQLARYEQLKLEHRLLKLESQKQDIDKESSRHGLKVLSRVAGAFLAGALLTPIAGDLATEWGKEVLPYPSAEEVQLRCEQTIYHIDGTVTKVEQP